MTEDREDGDDIIDMDKIVSTRKWLKQQANLLALSDPLCSWMHSDSDIDDYLEQYEPFSDYNSDLSDLDMLGPF